MNYKNAIISLFPKGRAWSTEAKSFFHSLGKGISLSFERVHLRAEDLLRESDPRTCSETLEDWERVYGLPEKCDVDNDFSLEKRFKVVNRAANFRGDQRPKYFEDYVKALGFDCKVSEFHEFRVDISSVEDPLSNGIDWVNTWMIEMPATLAYEFSVDISTVGEALRVFRNDSVECSLNHIKPAHTHIIFSYDNLEAEV